MSLVVDKISANLQVQLVLEPARTYTLLHEPNFCSLIHDVRDSVAETKADFVSSLYLTAYLTWNKVAMLGTWYRT